MNLRRRTSPPAVLNVTIPTWLPEPVGVAYTLAQNADAARHLAGRSGLLLGELGATGRVHYGDLGPLQAFRGQASAGNVIGSPPIALPSTAAPDPNPVLEQLVKAQRARNRGN